LEDLDSSIDSSLNNSVLSGDEDHALGENDDNSNMIKEINNLDSKNEEVRVKR